VGLDGRAGPGVSGASWLTLGPGKMNLISRFTLSFSVNIEIALGPGKIAICFWKNS
jgi:hypothetical protein